jgi:hypothetical protein
MNKSATIFRIALINLILFISANCYSFGLHQRIYFDDCNQIDSGGSGFGLFKTADGNIEKINFFKWYNTSRDTSSSFTVGKNLESLLATYSSGSTELISFSDTQAQIVFRYNSLNKYSIKDRKNLVNGKDSKIYSRCPSDSVAYATVINVAKTPNTNPTTEPAQANNLPKQPQAPVQPSGPSEAEKYAVNLKSWQRKYCVSSHLGKLSAGVREKAGEIFQTNPSKIEFKRFVLTNDECIITLYSDNGPKMCQVIFDQNGAGSLEPCPISESDLSALGAASRLFQRVATWSMFNDFKGTGRGGQ